MGSGVMLLREIMAFLLLLHGRVEFPLFFFKPIVGFSYNFEGYSKNRKKRLGNYGLDLF